MLRVARHATPEQLLAATLGEMDWYEQEVSELERSTNLRNTPEQPVVFYGSSSIRMWDTLSEDLGSDRVVNRGFGGSTLEACVYFFERLVSPMHPASLILYAGDNDLGDGCSVGQVTDRFSRFLVKLDACDPGMPFGFLGIKPSPSRAALTEKIAAANAEIRRLMSVRNGSGVFIETAGNMLDRAGRPRAEYYLPDGLHLSREGYKLWARLIRPYRKQLLI